MKSELTPPLVGRAEEVRTLTAALERAAQRQGNASFLIGETGIGKTRLARGAGSLSGQ